MGISDLIPGRRASGDPGMTTDHHILLPSGGSGRESGARSAKAEAAMDGTASVGGDAPLLTETCDEGVLRLTLNRPAQRNALSVGLMTALSKALDRAAADNECRVVVIAGAGPAFCAGHDLRELRNDNSRAAYERVFAQCGALMLQIIRLPKPVIAEVHGIATAAGCQLVATCDLAVAAE